MVEFRDWSSMRVMMERLLLQRSGADLSAWNERIRQYAPGSEKELRGWLTEQGVTGYAQMLLVMETFGYPDFYTTSADELIDAQYADRPLLRPIFDAILAVCSSLGAVTIQARKTYVSLLTPRRTFARIQPATRNRINLALRLENSNLSERLVPSKVHENMKWQVNLASLADLDNEALTLLQQAYLENS